MQRILSICLLLAGGAVVHGDDRDNRDRLAFFEKKIRPPLVKHCYQCHSAKAKQLRGKLRLDSRAGWQKGGESGPAIVPGKPEKSLLLKALRHDGLKMPPQRKLPQQTIADFERWIRHGAVDPRQGKGTTKKRKIDYARARRHWSFRPLIRPPIPAADRSWCRNPIDNFVAARLEQAAIPPGRQATARALLRRVHFDLIGLPPQAKLAKSFRVTDYARVVDDLLKSPRYGEHWARMWLDVARFAESYGFEMDQPRPDAWRYRDFVIRAFNKGMSYDQFVRWQIAGDLLHPQKVEAHIATGFLVAGVENIIQSRKEFARDRYDKLDDMVTTLGTSMLGLTVGCSRCHDHKYDAMSQREYYELAAPFGRTVSAVKTLRQENSQQTLKAFVATEIPGDRIRMITVTEPSFSNLPSIPAQVQFLVRGDIRQPKGFVKPGFPRLVASRSTQKRREHGRIELARWLTNTKSGAGRLLARVIVNRVWQQHFGRGLVATPNDFGTRGARPTHPKLLDWLATELIRQQWKLKPIHKLIVTSSTYRQAFRINSEARRKDPFNRLWWRRVPRRLSAEAIRDTLLSVAGRLNGKMYGPGTLNQNHPRRSIYLTVKRTKLISILQLFDAPDALKGIGQRTATTTAPQALLMLNNPFVAECVTGLTKQLAGLAPGAVVERAFLIALGRPPHDQEKRISRTLLQGEQGQLALCQMLVCLNEFMYIE